MTNTTYHFETKAAQKEALDTLNRAYSKVEDEHRKQVRAAAPADHDARWKHFDKYDVPFNLHQVREAKHAEIFAARWEQVAALIETRNEIKASGITPRAKLSPIAKKVGEHNPNLKAIEEMVVMMSEHFELQDEEFKNKSIEWADGRREALDNMKAEYDAAEGYNARQKVRQRMVNICGGNTWYGIIRSSKAARDAAVTESCKRTIEARNVTIAAKLDKVGATQITGGNSARTVDGFHGAFGVMTDAGSKLIEIQTIMAGGYNIQCLHLRTLVNVR